MTLPQPTKPALVVELTSYCNQRCAHCYNAFDHTHSRSLPTDALLLLLRRALDEVAFERIDLSGGEPTVHDGLLQALELCADRGVRANLMTNATFMTDNLVRQLARFPRLGVQVTLNGPNASCHDDAVGLPGAWQKVNHGIERLLHHGVSIAGAMVITHHNFSRVGETLDRMRTIGIRHVALMRLMTGGISAQSLELLPTRSDLLESLRQASAPRFHDMSLRVGGPLPPCVVDQSEFPTIRFGWCPIGTAVQDFVLGSDGQVRLCPFFDTVLGDAKKQSFDDLVRAPAVTSYRKRAPAFCRGCPALPRCLGGCGAAALAVTGDTDSVDPLVLQHVDADFSRKVYAARDRSNAPTG